MNTLINIVVGIGTGVLSAITFWWWQAKLLRPRITLCPTIARYFLPVNHDRKRQHLSVENTVENGST
jgi:hypothetical protein